MDLLRRPIRRDVYIRLDQIFFYLFSLFTGFFSDLELGDEKKNSEND